jgi:hypothetical protein
MARKVTSLTVASEGRDKGKLFSITEMPASQAEEWALRALFLAMQSGVEIPDELASAGLAGLATIGIKALAKIPFDLAKPLFDQLMACVQIVPDRTNQQFTRGLIEDDIEEITTRLQLRKAALMLHIDFFISAAPSTQEADAAVTSPV